MNKKRNIIIRSGSGTIKRIVEVLMLSVGKRATHNADGSFTYCRAVDGKGTYYETKSRGGGWRGARKQERILK